MSQEKDKRLNEVIRVQKRPNSFVMMDKTFLEDDTLSYKAKGILAYLLSKPDNWKVIVPNLVNFSADGEASVRSGLKELKEAGYYCKSPIRDGQGRRIERWESVVYEVPQETLETFSLLTDFQEIENQEIENLDVENREHSKIDKNKNDLNHIDNQSSQSDGQTGQDKTNVKTGNYLEENPKTNFEPSNPIESSVSELEQYSNIIKTNIRYSDFANTRANDLPLVDAFVSIILDVIFTKGGDVRIKQEIKDREIVKSQLLKLTHEHICLAIERFQSHTKPITHKKQYLLTTLYTVTSELEAHQTNVANQKKALEHPEVVAEKKDVKPEPPKSKNQFNAFPQRERTEEYYAALERHLLNKK